MPEGDTVHLAAARLRAALEGRVLARTDFRVPRYATLDLSGRRVESVAARGKHLLFRLEGDVTVHTHLEMDGTWHLYRPEARWREPGFEARVVLATEDRSAVGFRLPVIEVLPTAEEGRVVGHLGPDPLGPDWDAAEAVRRLGADPARPIGEALLDQRLIAGLGNVYKSEICFLRGLDPLTPVAEVPDLPRLVDLAARLLGANRSTGNQNTTGDTRPGRGRWVYGRVGKPCLRCGDMIRRAEQHGPGGPRVTFWCPRCQAHPGHPAGAGPRFARPAPG